MTALPATASITSTTRERLIAAAIEVFVADGYDSARVQDIARAAGLTTGAIYGNFRGKAELLFDAIGARADAEIEGLLHDAAGHEARALLGLLGDRLVQPREHPPLLLDAIAASRRDPSLGAMLRERLGAREDLVARLVDQARHDGAVDAQIATDVLARFCITLALGALAARALELDAPDPDGWHSLIARLLDACAPDPSGSGSSAGRSRLERERERPENAGAGVGAPPGRSRLERERERPENAEDHA